jgi:hypothetical protein
VEKSDEIEKEGLHVLGETWVPFFNVTMVASWRESAVVQSIVTIYNRVEPRRDAANPPELTGILYQVVC